MRSPGTSIPIATPDGQFDLVRGVLGLSRVNSMISSTSSAILDAPDASETTGLGLPCAPPKFGARALERARGNLRMLRLHGFRMDSGAVFLETHHVIPLSEGGPDEIWNVVAICPNDHRRAHFGADRDSIRA